MDRIEIYDEFKCLADRCPFTCCVGWDISVDSDTYSQWADRKGLSDGLGSSVTVKKHGKKRSYSINMGQRKICPFLNNKGLCSIVIEYGEMYQPKACRDFPRLSAKFEDRMEASLSLACPAVVDLLWSRENGLRFDFTGEAQETARLSIGCRIRNTMIAVMQNHSLAFRDRILLNFWMLLSIRSDRDNADKIRSEDESTQYLLGLAGLWKEVKPDHKDQLQEINELFLDITMNYRREHTFKDYLADIYHGAEVLDMNEAVAHRDIFHRIFAHYEQLMENVLASAIYSECISDDTDELIMSYQVIITEYLMVKHSEFLKWLAGTSGDPDSEDCAGIEYQDIRNLIVIYSRILGHNAEGLREFWAESFDEAIWEFGYLVLLLH